MRKEPREIETIEMEVEAVPLAALTLLSAVHVRCFHLITLLSALFRWRGVVRYIRVGVAATSVGRPRDPVSVASEVRDIKAVGEALDDRGRAAGDEHCGGEGPRRLLAGFQVCLGRHCRDVSAEPV